MIAAANRIGLRSSALPSITTMPVFTTVLVSAATVIACSATSALPVCAYWAIDSVIASTSVVPARAATT